MTPPKKIYLQVCGTCQDNECDKCDFDHLQKTTFITWCRDRINDNDVAYFSEQAIREAEFAILNQVCESLGSTFGIILNSAKITEDIIQVLKGAPND